MRSKPLFLLAAPLSYAASTLLEQAATAAGWRQCDYEIAYASESYRGSSGRNLIAAFGDRAVSACLGNDQWQYGYARERRGYLWQGVQGNKVLSLMDPEDCVLRKDPSGINGMLLAADLEKAKKEAACHELVRISRNITVVHEYAVGLQLRKRLAGEMARVACDIECYDSERLQCIGFATSATEAYVFVGEALAAALEIVADPGVSKVFQNGAFDAYFLATRCHTCVANWQDDCMIAWHALWPEIAGKGKAGSKQTRKSLAFLASLYTESPEWWKEYGGDDASMYELNGRDCCITFEIMTALRQELLEQDVMDIYRHEMSMMPVLVAIQERGLNVNNGVRLANLEELERRNHSVQQGLLRLAEPLLHERRLVLTKPHLFFGTARCRCCGGGSKKAAACWSCAGFDKAPSKRQLGSAELGPCGVCNGVGKFETFEFNPASTQQQAELFYSVLKLPPRYNEGKLTVDEKALKNLLGSL